VFTYHGLNEACINKVNQENSLALSPMTWVKSLSPLFAFAAGERPAVWMQQIQLGS